MINSHVMNIACRRTHSSWETEVTVLFSFPIIKLIAIIIIQFLGPIPVTNHGTGNSNYYIYYMV